MTLHESTEAAKVIYPKILDVQPELANSADAYLLGQFAAYWADKLPERTTPQGFLLSAELSLRELKDDADLETGRAIENCGIAGNISLEDHELIRKAALSYLARLAFSKTFADLVDRALELEIE